MLGMRPVISSKADTTTAKSILFQESDLDWEYRREDSAIEVGWGEVAGSSTTCAMGKVGRGGRAWRLRMHRARVCVYV